MLKLTVNGSQNKISSKFFKNEDFNASKRTDERKLGKMAKTICEESWKNDDED
jgi:hypothetical protein